MIMEPNVIFCTTGSLPFHRTRLALLASKLVRNQNLQMCNNVRINPEKIIYFIERRFIWKAKWPSLPYVNIFKIIISPFHSSCLKICSFSVSSTLGLRQKRLKSYPKKVQVGKDQEKAQSERDSYSKNRGGKKPN